MQFACVQLLCSLRLTLWFFSKMLHLFNPFCTLGFNTVLRLKCWSADCLTHWFQRLILSHAQQVYLVHLWLVSVRSSVTSLSLVNHMILYNLSLSCFEPGGEQNHQPSLVCICPVIENKNMLSHLQYRVSPVLKMASSSSKGSAVSLSLTHRYTHTQQVCVHLCITGRWLFQRTHSTHECI